jgi:hypothetical protein
LLVVYCLPALVGILELRGMMVSIKPPMVSIPNDSGVTSSSKISLRLPAKTSACMAAPRATTSSGFTSSCTGRPKNSATIFLTKRGAGTATNHHYLINIGNRKFSIFQCILASGNGLLHFGQYQFFKSITVDSAPDVADLFIKKALMSECFLGFLCLSGEVLA